MKINPAKHTVCEKGHMYRHKKHDSCPVCLNNKLQIQRNDSIKNKLSGLTYPQQKLLRDYPLTYNVCVVHNQFHSISEGCPKCITSLNYCGKFMYTREQAKERVRKSRGQLQGFYYCKECDAHHVTKQSQEPERVQWFKDHPKQFRNKHV